MVDAEVIELAVPAKEVASLVVHHQLLDEFLLLEHVQMQTCGRLAGPKLNMNIDHIRQDIRLTFIHGSWIQ